MQEDEQRQLLRRRPSSPAASVDMFGPSQNDNYEDDLDLSSGMEPETNTVNPFLAAKLKKESGAAGKAAGAAIRKPTQGEGGHNPFAKKANLSVVPSSQPPASGTIRSGLVFDDMKKEVRSYSVEVVARPIAVKKSATMRFFQKQSKKF